MNMKAMFSFFLVCFSFFITSSCNGSSTPGNVSQEELRALLTWFDDHNSLERALTLGSENPNLIERILFIPDEEVYNETARNTAFSCWENCGILGKISHEKYFDVSVKLIANLDKIASPLVQERERAIFKGQITNYGYNPTQNVQSLKVTENSRAFSICIKEVFKNSFIKSKALFERILTLANLAQQHLVVGAHEDIEKAILELRKIVSILEKADRESISSDGLDIVSGYAKNLILQIKKQ